MKRGNKWEFKCWSYGLKVKESLDRATSLLKERQKLILLADKSPYGWKTVVEYKHHDFVEDEDDEKKICRAEARAARAAKHFATRSFGLKVP